MRGKNHLNNRKEKGEFMKKKNIVLIGIIVLLVMLLFPIPMKLKDGGSIQYKALLYKITNYHKLASEGSNKEYIDGIGIEILGIEVMNTANKIEKISTADGERLDNTEDIKLSSFVGTILEETTKYMIVEPNKDEEERKSADKIQINYGTDHIDYLYGVGRKVVIYYTGEIMESYPAKINTNNISINGYEDFEITVKASKNVRKKKILNNKDLAADSRDFNLYYYGLDEVRVNVNNKNMSLEEALKSGKITLSGIEQKANKDFPNAISYDDGGSMEYHYKNYTIIKVHKLDGNRDVYIGDTNMKLSDLKL